MWSPKRADCSPSWFRLRSATRKCWNVDIPSHNPAASKPQGLAGQDMHLHGEVPPLGFRQ
jgi:hypothetical protein